MNMDKGKYLEEKLAEFQASIVNVVAHNKKKRIIQEMLYQLIPGTFGGYDHCDAFLPVRTSFVCGA